MRSTLRPTARSTPQGERAHTLDPSSGDLDPVLRVLPAVRLERRDLAIIEGTLFATATAGPGTRIADDLLAIILRLERRQARPGTTGFPCVYGLAAHGDALFGFTCDGFVLSIDSASGLGKVVNNLPGETFYGATER